jgi:hypothetical protein
MSDSQDTKPLLDLSDLRLAPKWVSDFGKSSPSSAPDHEESGSRLQRGGGRDFRDSRDRRGPRSDQRGPRPDSRGPRDGGGQYRGGGGAGQGQQGDRNRSRDGRGRPGDRDRDRNRDRDRRDFRDQRPQQEAPPRLPAGLTAEIEPESRATEAMAAMIRNAGKAYSVFDAARLVLSSGDRFHVKFSLPKESEAKLYAIPADGSLWLSREEAIEHFLNSEGIKEFYRVEEVQLEAPKGNFTSVAICGLSGTLLGPPSHHSYQTTLHRIHRERFAHMSFEDYKRRVRTDNSPEAVEKWKESLTHGTEWIVITPGSEPGPEPAAEEASTAQQQTPEAAAAETPVAAESETPDATDVQSVEAEPVVEAVGAEPSAEITDSTEATSGTPSQSPAAIEAPAVPEVRLKSRAEMQAHFRENFAPTLVHETNVRYVAGNVPRQNLNPALYQLLRRSVDETRKHLLSLAQRLCIGFEQQGLKLFKRRGGKLWVSRARPRLLDSSVVLSERISLMMQIVKAQPGITAKALIEAVTPATAKTESESSTPTPTNPEIAAAVDAAPAIVAESTVDAAPQVEIEAIATAAAATPEASAEQMGALKDLHWLNSEGYVIEYADGQVFPGVTEPPPAKPKAEKAAAARAATATASASEAETSASASAEPSPPADAEAESPTQAEDSPIQAATELAPAKPAAESGSAESIDSDTDSGIGVSVSEPEAEPVPFDFLLESPTEDAPVSPASDNSGLGAADDSSAEPLHEAGFLIETEDEVDAAQKEPVAEDAAASEPTAE